MPRDASSTFDSRIVERCPAMRSVWRISATVLIGFADAATLAQLRRARELHCAETAFLVVTDGNRLESAWGVARTPGSLLRCGWREDGSDEAYYDESRWTRARDGNVAPIRRKAVRLWARPELAAA